MSDNNGNGAFMSPEQFGAYVQRVKNLEDKFDGLDRTLHALDMKIDKIAQPKWTLISQMAAAGFVLFGGLGTYFYLPLKNSVDNQAEKQVALSIDNSKLTAEHNAMERRVTKLEFNQENVRDRMVPLAVHEQHWKTDQEAREAIRDVVRKLEDRVDAIQGIKK